MKSRPGFSKTRNERSMIRMLCLGAAVAKRVLTNAARAGFAAIFIAATIPAARGADAFAATTGNAAAKSPWGPADETGTLNMMSDGSRLAVLRRVEAGRIYDLGVDLFVGMPACCASWGNPGYQIWMTHAPARSAREKLSHSGDAFSMSTHIGTHIDTLNHFGLDGKIWNQISASDALGVRGWNRSGADKYPHIVARGVLIDVARSKQVAHLPESYAITVADLQEALDKQRTTLRSGDVVLIRTGLMTQWPDETRYRLANQAGLGLEAARWLVEGREAMLLGSDNFGVESFPSRDPANFAPVHSYLLAERGVSLLEVLWLEELSEDRVYEFLFIASPLKLRGATAAPVRPLAIPIGRGS